MSLESVQQWWEETVTLLSDAHLAPLTWCMIDLNAPLASQETSFFGLAGAESPNPQGIMAEQMLQSLAWYVPSTMPWCHHGSHETWTHPRGHKLRRDFLCCSSSAFALCGSTWVDVHFDGGFGHDDHFPVVLHNTGWLESVVRDQSIRWDQLAFVDPIKCRRFQDAVQSLPIPTWDVHIDCHAQLFETQLLSLAKQHFVKTTRDRTRPRLTESTLNLIQFKRSCLDYGRCHDLMQDAEFRQELHAIEKDVRKAVRQDQRAFYAALVDQLASAGQLHDAKTMYRLLSRLGGRPPKRSSIRAHPLITADGQCQPTFEAQQRLWMRQFAEVEAGNIMSKSEFLRLLPPALGVSPDVFDINVIPTLAEVRSQVHRLKRGKAPGPDQIPPDVLKAGAEPLAKHLTTLIVKTAANAREPGSWRGGRLVPLHKGKLPKTDPQGYRSIFLNGFVTKIYHSAIRKHLVDAWSSVLTHLQLGGRKGLGCDSAHHLVQAHLAHGSIRKLPVGVVFVDFRAAFYSVLRQCLFAHPLDDTGFLIAMARLGIHPDQVQSMLQHASGEAAICNICPHALQLLQDVLRSTYFQIDGIPEVATTNRGTRPGDPIGDIAFNLLMAVLMKEITAEVQVNGRVWEGDPVPVRDFSVSRLPALNAWTELAYVDDLAVLLRAVSNQQLADLTHAVLPAIVQAAHKRGLELTYGSGKTEVLWHLRGVGTRAFKERLRDDQGCLRVEVPTRSSAVSVPVVLSYKHLGTWIHNDAKPMHAIWDRIAAARKAWGPLVRPFFSKRSIALRTKVQVFESLVMSRFMFNAHVWSLVSPQALDEWANAMRPMLYALARPALRGLPPFSFGIETLCGLCHILPPADALHVARLRYLRRLVVQCPNVLWNLLTDVADHPGAWISLLRDSFAWLTRFSSARFGLSADSDLGDWLAFVAIDPRWKGRIHRAASACRFYRNTHATTDVWHAWLSSTFAQWGVDFSPAHAPDVELPWTCDLCAQSFPNKVALSMHAVKVHGYQTLVRHYAVDGRCPNCCRDYHNRARLCAHLRTAEVCLARIRASFPPLTKDALDHLNAADLEYAHAMKQQGWLATKAKNPVVRAFGPALPPPGSVDALCMFNKWVVRNGLDPQMPYEQLVRSCLRVDIIDEPDAPLPAAGDIGDLAFVMHSAHGVLHGDNGVFSMKGLAKLYAKLHIRTICFVHFYSGYRREGDLQHQIDRHEIQGVHQIFCLSIDFCLHGTVSDLTKACQKEFWTRQIQNGAVVGIGGGPPCETFTAARMMDDGPPVLRTYDEPLGVPHNSPRQWRQVLLGTLLMQFILEMAVLCARHGGCAFIEHPAFPIWARHLRPVSIWSSQAVRWLKRLHCSSIVTFDQCIFACEARKPTTLLLVRLPHLRDFILQLGDHGRCAHPVGTHVTLRGRDQSGSFRTAIAKVYPPAMNAALAKAIIQFVQDTFEVGVCTEPLPLELEALLSFDFVSRTVIQQDCILNHPSMLQYSLMPNVVFGGRILVYTMGFLRLVYWHTLEIFKAYRHKVLSNFHGLWVPQYLTRGAAFISFMLTLDMLAMMTVEPLFHCFGQGIATFQCNAWTDTMSLTYEILVTIGVFLYVMLIVEVGSISIKLSEYRVLCIHAVEQILLCLGVVFLVILTFAFAISGMDREVQAITGTEWSDLGNRMNTLIRLAFGAMDLGALQNLADESPLLVLVILLFMMLVYSFFFNLLVSQFCGVYHSLAADIKGHARLARGEIIIETFKAVKLSRWQTFMTSLNLETRVDFEEGDIGLAGGIKTYEPALAHPIAKDQIVRFGGQTDGKLPWPEKTADEKDNLERTVQKTIQKSLHKLLGGMKKSIGGASTLSSDVNADEKSSSHHSSGKGGDGDADD
eukprot:s702_g6.t1